MAPKKRHVTARKELIATATITVLDVTEGQDTPIADAVVEIQGVPAANGTGKTNPQGVFTSKVFRPGDFVVKVSKQGFGVPASPVVKPVDFVQKIHFVSNDQIPNPPFTNKVVIQLAQVNPLIIVRAFLVSPSSPRQPLAQASVTIIGQQPTGFTDASGMFVSNPMPYGNHGVNVTKQGLEPDRRISTIWHQVVELRLGGALVTTSPRDRNLTLEAEFIPIGGPRTVSIPQRHPRPIAVWADGSSTPHHVDADPRLPGPGDSPQGQAGWDIGVQFANFRNLVSTLTPGVFQIPSHAGGGFLERNQIMRLAIVAHGDPGDMDIDQTAIGDLGRVVIDENRALTVARLPVYKKEIDAIGKLLHRDSTVFLMACNVGDGAKGEDLLKALSMEWPTTKVVGIRSLVAVSPGNSKGGGFHFAGVRDTHFGNDGRPATKLPPRDYEDPIQCQDLTKIPWVSETSPRATVALEGSIIRRGDFVA